MSPNPLPEFFWTAHSQGWSAPLPNAPRFFGREIGLDIHTRPIDSIYSAQSEPPPPVSDSQASLVREILLFLPSIVDQVERALIAYEKDDPDFQRVVLNPHIWLSIEDDDRWSWAFVVESTENPDFGWHAEFKGSELKELWSGD